MQNEKYFVIEDNAEFEVLLCHLPGLEDVSPNYVVNRFGEVRYIGPGKSIEKPKKACCHQLEHNDGQTKYIAQDKIDRIVAKYFPTREVNEIVEILDVEPSKVINILQKENVGYVYALNNGDIVFNQKVTDKILVELIERRKAVEEEW